MMYTLIMLYLGISISVQCFKLHELIVFLCQAIRVVLVLYYGACTSVSAFFNSIVIIEFDC